MIKLNNVVFNYQSMPMVFDLQIQAQEKIAIIGESGAGKSTLLNLIAGFEYADSGEIWLNGENHTNTAPFERPVSMLFQENNLFTHLSVEENIALGLKPNLPLNAEEKALVEQAASAVNLQDFLTRKRYDGVQSYSDSYRKHIQRLPYRSIQTGYSCLQRRKS